MDALELASTKTILAHYVLDDPDARTAEADEKWLIYQDIGWLQRFENAMRCLDVVLCRVIDQRRRGG